MIKGWLVKLAGRFASWWRGPEAPSELLDPEGEGIYLLDDYAYKGARSSVLRHAAYLLGLTDDRGRLDWRAVQTETVWMRPGLDDHWHPVDIGRGWVLNRRRAKRPALYAYCTPPSDPALSQHDSEESHGQ